MWSLVCAWGGGRIDERAVGHDDAGQRLADTARALHLLAGRAPVWQDWTGSEVETVVDAAAGGGAGRLRALLADFDTRRVPSLELTLHSAVGDDLDGPSSTLWVDLRRGSTSSLEWVPLDLADRVLSEPAVARAVLAAVAGIWDADAAAWTRSDVDALHGSGVPTGWMTYRAGLQSPPPGLAARRLLRGVLTGPDCAADDYGPRQAAAVRDVLAHAG